MAKVLLPKYTLVSDAPPLRHGGHGCHVLAWRWLEVFQDYTPLVVSRRMNPRLDPKKILSDLPVPALLYPDSCGLRMLGRVPYGGHLLDMLLFRRRMPFLVRRIRESGSTRLFFFFGGNPWFLHHARWLMAETRLPADIYLVDDLEESAKLARQFWVARRVPQWEAKVLARADRVFAISSGYCEHLAQKYGIPAELLPTSISDHGIRHVPFIPRAPDVRDLTFIGAVNPLYLEALRDCMASIDEWNRDASRSFRLRLLLMTYSNPGFIRAELGGGDNLEILVQPAEEVFKRRLKESWALFLPYSFEDRVRTMVRTSFPTKLCDSFPVGRPILVYGPADASVPRYFRENRLPLSAVSLDELGAKLRRIADFDRPNLISLYRERIQERHSPEVLRRTLSLN